MHNYTVCHSGLVDTDCVHAVLFISDLSSDHKYKGHFFLKLLMEHTIKEINFADWVFTEITFHSSS